MRKTSRSSRLMSSNCGTGRIYCGAFDGCGFAFEFNPAFARRRFDTELLFEHRAIVEGHRELTVEFNCLAVIIKRAVRIA